jgi:hypothetical protein
MELVLWKCKRTLGQVHAAALQSTSFWRQTFIVWILKVFFGRTRNCLWQQMAWVHPPPPILWNCQKLKQKLTQIDWHMWSWCMENPPRLKIFLGGWSLYQLWFCGFVVKFCHQLFKCWFYVKLISPNSFVISNSTSYIFFNFGPFKKNAYNDHKYFPLFSMAINIIFQMPIYICIWFISLVEVVKCSWSASTWMHQLKNTFNNFPCAMNPMNPLLQCLDSNCEFHNLRTHYYFIHMWNICRHIVLKNLVIKNPCHLSPTHMFCKF